MQPIIRQRDFVEDHRGWLYAVVLPCESRRSSDSLIVSLRYRRDLNGVLQKLETKEADELLGRDRGGLVEFVDALGCEVAVLQRSHVRQHFCAKDRLRRLLQVNDQDSLPSQPMVGQAEATKYKEGMKESALEGKAVRVAQALLELGVSTEDFGVTGSMLVNAHRATSDLDFVLYNKRAFRLAQALARDCSQSAPDLGLWREAYEKRRPSLSFEEFLWHEQRKANKFWLSGSKIDLSLSRPQNGWRAPARCRKLERVVIRAGVTDDQFAFDTPASWSIDCEEAERLLCWTATYTGQTAVGEQVEIAGCLEETETGRQIVVGSSREARGEFIRVVNPIPR
jgi:predicted nucleotidyltransferase